MPNQNALMSILPFIFIMVVFYFFIIKPQKKKEKEISQMRDSIKVGDKVITIGGITGRVVSVKEELLEIETTGNNTRFEIMKWGINSIIEK